MTDIDKILLGTEWIKTAAKHYGQKGRIDKVGPRGPRMRLVGLPVQSRHGSGTSSSQPQYQRLDWFELGNTWEPERGSLSRYKMWQDAVHIEGLDKKLEKLQTESDNTIMNPITEPTSPVEEEVSCTSVYHLPKGGRVGISHAYKTRQDNWVCLDCRAKREEYQRNQAERMRAAKVAKKATPKEPTVIEAPKPLVIEPYEDLPRWRVTIVEPTVHVVQARDFLDLAAMFEGKGQIVKVEKI